MEQRATDLAMLTAVQNTITAYHLLPSEGWLVVGVSGGPDSVCLLHLLKRLCASDGPFPRVSLHVAHLEHGIRGEESRADAAFVADLAQQWSLPYTVESVDVPALARKERLSLEDAARRARYQFLRCVAAAVGAARIAVAHHAGDQVETLVMHWLRGSGLAGLAGMRPREGDIIRPLLEISREDILRYCQAHALPFREDSSNLDKRFLRNRLRQELLPVLEQYNANLRETLLRNAAVLAEEDTYIEAQIDACWSEVIGVEGARRLEGDVAAYRRLPLALRRRLIRRLGQRVSSGEVSLELRHVAAVDDLLLQQAGSGMLHLPGGLRLYRASDRFVVGHAAEQKHQQKHQEGWHLPGKNEVSLPVPGEAQLPGTPWLVRAQVLERDRTPPPGYERGDAGRRWGYLDFDAVQKHGALSLRARRSGDRFRPLGMPVEAKLQDVLVNAKIARAERDILPLVCGADGMILWVAGYQVADPVKLTTSTSRVLVLERVAAPDEKG